ncbi:MAG TPA: amidohydrolase family protein [Microlunatus sp.]|nr:amidohydrolase family protein [Microlunatus sp.]
MGWTFEGVLLPSGGEGRVVVGAEDLQPLPGRFALAGLVDAHCHLTVGLDEIGPHLDGPGAERRLRDLAQDGVGLVRDVGGDRAVTLPLSRHPVPGWPQVQAAGRFLAPAGGYFPRMHEPVAPADLLEAIETEIAAGATWIKIIGDFPLVDGDRPRPGTSRCTYPPDVVAAAVQTAHRLGARVAVHTNTGVVSDLVAAGVDSVEHGLALTDGDLDQLGARGGAWTPTLASFAAIRRSADPALQPLLAGHAERLPALLRAAIERGVTIMTGSDVVGTVAEEIGLLHAYGLTVDEALRAATTAARQYLGGSSGEDLVTYEHDPRANPDLLRAPAAVVIRGVRVR